MHDDAVLSLWKEHRGVERPGADLDAQWDRRIIKPMQYVLENETPDEVSSTFADGKMTLTASARPHSACALLAYLANLADANPYPYVGLSCKYPCYACWTFFSAYKQSGSTLPLHMRGPMLNFYIPFAFPAFSDHEFNNTVRRQMSTLLEDDLWQVWDDWQNGWYDYGAKARQNDVEGDGSST